MNKRTETIAGFVCYIVSDGGEDVAGFKYESDADEWIADRGNAKMKIRKAEASHVAH